MYFSFITFDFNLFKKQSRYQNYHLDLCAKMASYWNMDLHNILALNAV